MLTLIFGILLIFNILWWGEDNIPRIVSVMEDIDRNGRPYVTVETYRDKDGTIKHRWVTVPRQPGWVGARMAWESLWDSWVPPLLTLYVVCALMGI